MFTFIMFMIIAIMIAYKFHKIVYNIFNAMINRKQNNN